MNTGIIKNGMSFLLFSGLFLILSLAADAQYFDSVCNSKPSDYFSEGTAISATIDSGRIVAGYFSASITFAESEPGGTTLTSAGGYDGYIVKYSSDGSFVWGKQIGGTSNDFPRSIDYYSDNTFIVAGDFTGSCVFGKGEAGETTLISNGGSDMFLAKYYADGTLSWAKSFGGTDNDFMYHVIFDRTNAKIIICGAYSTQITFGLGESNETTLISAGSLDMFIAMFKTSDASLEWAKSAGGTGSDIMQCIVTDTDGSVFAGGGFSNSATFAPGLTLTSSGAADMFLAKYNYDGGVAWVKQGKSSLSTSLATAVDIAILNGNSLAVVGNFGDLDGGSILLGEGELYQTTLTSVGSTDFFTARYWFDGSLAWAKSSGGIYQDTVKGITTAGLYCYLTGNFSETMHVSFGMPDEKTLDSEGSLDIFIAYYDYTGSLAYAKRAGGASIQVSNGIAVDSVNHETTITGYYSNTTIFGKSEPNEATITAPGSACNFYTAKFTSSPKPRKWRFSGKVGSFDRATDIINDSGIGLNPNGSINCFGFWLSPDITVKRDKTYMLLCYVSSDNTDSSTVPQFRIRAVQPSNWNSCIRVVESYNDAAPSTAGAKIYKVFFNPQMTTETDVINIAFDVLSFNPADNSSATIYLSSVYMFETNNVILY